MSGRKIKGAEEKGRATTAINKRNSEHNRVGAPQRRENLKNEPQIANEISRAESHELPYSADARCSDFAQGKLLHGVFATLQTNAKGE